MVCPTKANSIVPRLVSAFQNLVLFVRLKKQVCFRRAAGFVPMAEPWLQDPCWLPGISVEVCAGWKARIHDLQGPAPRSAV